MTNLVATLSLMLQALEPSVAADRADAIASDMAEVVEAEKINDTGLDTVTSLAMMAGAVVVESGLMESIEKCKASGDGGKSIGLGQVMRGTNWEGHTKKEICSDRKLQLKLSLHVLQRCVETKPATDAVFRCYTSGSPNVGSYTARREHKAFMKVKTALVEAVRSGTQTPVNSVCTFASVVRPVSE